MQVIGIQIDNPFIRIALLQKKGGEIKLCTLKSIPLSESKDVKQLYFPLFKGQIASGLPTKDILIRSIELKITHHKHLKEALKFHYDATTHFDLADIISVPYPSKKPNGEIETLLFTTPKEALKKHLLELQELKIEPHRVTTYSMALVRYIQWKVPSLKNAFLIDLGSSEWTCVLMEEGKLKKAHSLPYGMEALLGSLWEDRKKILLAKEIEGVAKQIDLLQLKSHLNPNLSSKINEMRREITKIIFSFHRTSQQQPLIFTGNTDGLGHLPEFLIEELKEAILPPPTVSISIEEKKYAIAIGLGLEQTHHSIQFLQEEFFPKKIFRLTGFYSLLLFASSCFLSFSLLLIGIKSIESRKSTMIDSLEITLDQSDPLLKQSIFSDSSDKELILNRWMSTVTKHNKEYPYILQAPKMHETLSWLNHHPLLKQLKEEGNPIDIEEIRYQLVEFPTIESPQQSHQAKIEIDFKTQNSIDARKFHEFLLKRDPMVDTSSDIQWETLDNSYHTSFFLKNRGSHVP